MSSVIVEGLSKSFGPLSILKAVDLEVKEGEFTVLLGPSGCGKSTLLNLIAGLEQPDQGHIKIDGKDVTSLEPSQRELAMVFQSYALFPTMTVRENLSFGMKIRKVEKSVIAERVAKIADMLQITALLDRKPSQLSGGQRQRVAIGRALARSPKICLFDEPLSNLDAKLRNETRVELKRLHGQLGSTMIYVTHDQVEALTMADRVAVMKGGLIEQYAPPQTIYDKPATVFVAGFLGSPSMNFSEAQFSSGKVIIDGVALDCAHYEFSSLERPADVVVGIRPEDLTIADDQHPRQPKFAATRHAVEPLGPDTVVWFSVGGKKWSLRMPTSSLKDVGESFFVTVNTKNISLFDASSEQRV